jgi:Ni,Fe-hydrogenase III component G
MKTIEAFKSKFSNLFLKWEQKAPRRVYCDIRPSDIVAVAAYLFNDLGARFVIISGIDTRDGIEVLYHFSDDSTGTMITLRTLIVDKKDPKIESLSALIKGTAWIEREVHELLGVTFIGNPNMKHLLLPEDWPEGRYPLRHDNE